MINTFLILIGKLVSFISKSLNKGSGSTWPGHIALSLNKNFIKDVLKKNPALKIVLIAGTNGKTTTAKLVQTILEADKKRVFCNFSGANLLNGIASSLLLHSSILCDIKHDFAIFEVDENSLPLVLNELTPHYLVILNLFRDQLDRYGEVNTIASKWVKAMKQLNNETILILNADDPQIAWLGMSSFQNDKVKYFGLNDKKLSQKKEDHATDSTYCPSCGNKLTYTLRFFSHLGIWNCLKCKNKRPALSISSFPTYPLLGIYNRYNTLAAVLLAKSNNISNIAIQQSLKTFSPAFGRQEILYMNGKKVQIFLSKNPTSFNQSLRTVIELKGKHLLLVLNDRIPDGRDVSWIWDVDFEELDQEKIDIYVSGDRAYDMGLRMKYANSSKIKNEKLKVKNNNLKFKTYEDLQEAIHSALEKTPKSETLYILPTYSAMLEVRKILTGKKIL